MAYSKDFRSRVLEYILSGNSQVSAEFSCCIEDVRKALKRLNTLKKAITFYKERDEVVRNNFQFQLLSIPKETLVYIDETGIVEYLYRLYCRRERGEKVYI